LSITGQWHFAQTGLEIKKRAVPGAFFDFQILQN
jgi:hypothetical protein